MLALITLYSLVFFLIFVFVCLLLLLLLVGWLFFLSEKPHCVLVTYVLS